MKHHIPAATALSVAAIAPADANIPTYEELLADPEIAALIGFAPVPRRNKKEGGWSAGMQRMFIARLARHGSPGKACDELGMYRSGVDKLFKSAGADSFRAAWAAAVALAERRRAEHVAAGHASVADLRMPFVDNRRGRGGQGTAARAEAAPLPGQMRNEHGGYEDAESLARRAEEAGESIARKLLRLRRLYLQEISGCPGKRAAFEILTELPIDWDKAERGEAQADEPYRTSDQREPDMVLLAESGWSWGEIGYGPDRKEEARKAIDEHRAEMGLEPIDWSESTERSDADD